MKRRGALLIALAPLVAACSATTDVTVGTPSPGQTPTIESPSPSPSRRPPVPRARRAVYELGGSLWLYEVEADTVRQVTQQGSVRLPRFISADQISFVSDGVDGSRASALMRLDLRAGQISEVFRVSTGIATYGWSPDRTSVAYVTVDDLDFPQVHFRSLSSGAIRTVATLARQYGREGVDDDQLEVSFSPDGERVLVVYTVAGGGGEEPSRDGASFQVRTADGALAFAPEPDAGATMGVWAPDGSAVYYRTADGARSWPVEGGDVRALAGAPFWYEPSVSRNGRYVAYDTGASDPNVRIKLLDLRRGELRNLSRAGRAHPVFASNRVVWAQRIRRCTGVCLVPGEPVNEVYAIDIRDGNERRVAIASLLDLDVLYR